MNKFMKTIGTIFETIIEMCAYLYHTLSPMILFFVYMAIVITQDKDMGYINIILLVMCTGVIFYRVAGMDNK